RRRGDRDRREDPLPAAAEGRAPTRSLLQPRGRWPGERPSHRRGRPEIPSRALGDRHARELRPRSSPRRTSIPTFWVRAFPAWRVAHPVEGSMSIFVWIIIGLLAGLIARAIMPGEQPGGVIVTILLGIGGAFLGGWLGSAIVGKGLTGFSFWSLLLAVVGALILLFAYQMITG